MEIQGGLKMIIKVEKTDMKLKDIKFENGVLIDSETGETISLVSDLARVFGDREFTLTATVTNKSEYDVDDFAK